MARRNSYHHGDLRQALIDAALELVRKEGLSSWTLRGVARHCGVSHAAPYHHFADKEALLGAMTALGFDRLTAQLAAAADGAGDIPQDRLRAAARAYIAFGADNPGLYQVMFREVRSSAQGSVEGREAGMRAMELLVIEIISAQIAGQAPIGDPTHLVLPSWSMLHGFVSLAVLGPLPGMGLVDDERFGPLADAVVDAALRTLG